MKDLLSKEHYCYKIHTLLMKNSAYPHLLEATSPMEGFPCYEGMGVLFRFVILFNVGHNTKVAHTYLHI